jgi:hypothetical protein
VSNEELGLMGHRPLPVAPRLAVLAYM